MVRKLSIAIAAGMLVSGAAAAHNTSPFPMSSNETGVYEPERDTALAHSPITTRAQAPAAQGSTFPMSVSETGPNQSEGIPASTAAAPNFLGIAGSSGFPISVNETGPNSGGGYAAVRASSAHTRTAAAE
jgi:hypothetical protein